MPTILTDLTPDGLGISHITLRAIDQMDAGEARVWLDHVTRLIERLPPIKQRQGRQPDFRTGMQDQSVFVRLWLQMARTDLSERCRVLLSRSLVPQRRRRRGWGCSRVTLLSRLLPTPGPDTPVKGSAQ